MIIVIPEDIKKRKFDYSLLAIFMAGAALRVINLGSKSFWMDEITSVLQAQMPWAEAYRDMTYRMTGFFSIFLLRYGIAPLGINEWTGRVLSTIFSIFMILAIYYLGSALINRNVGLISAFLLAINPYQIYYAQEIRPYAIITFFAVLSYLALYEYLYKNSNWRWWIIYLISTVLGIQTHFIYGFLIAGQVAFLIYYLIFNWRKEGFTSAIIKKCTSILCSWILVSLIFLPVLPMLRGDTYANQQVTREISLSIGYWVQTIISTVANVFRAFGSGYVPGPQWLIGLSATLFCVSAFFGIILLLKKRAWNILTFQLSWLIVPMILLLGVNYYFDTGFSTRYFAYFLPPILILASILIEWLIIRLNFLVGVKLPIGGVIFGVSSIFIFTPFLIGYYSGQKMDYRDAAKFIESNKLPTDVIYINSMDQGQIEYYFSKGSQDQIRYQSLNELVVRCQAGNRVWFIGSHVISESSIDMNNWVRIHMQFMVEYPAFTKDGTVSVYFCGEIDPRNSLENKKQEKPGSPQEWLRYAQVYQQAGDYKQSIAAAKNGLDICSSLNCDDTLRFRLHLFSGTSYRFLGIPNKAMKDILSGLELPVSDEFIHTYSPEIENIIEFYVLNVLTRKGGVSENLVQGGNFETENDLYSWNLQPEEFDLRASLTADCAYEGKNGLKQQGASNKYHNGINIQLPENVKLNQFYVVGAYLRANDQGITLSDHLLLSPMYIGGIDKSGNYRGFGLNNYESGSRWKDWQIQIRTFRIQEWMTGKLYLSPVLMEGKGTVCVDNVFYMTFPGVK